MDPRHNRCEAVEASEKHRGDDVSFDELCSFVVMLGGNTEDLYGWEAQLEEGPGGSSDAVGANALTPVYYSPWGERFPTVESVTSLFGLRKGNEQIVRRSMDAPQYTGRTCSGGGGRLQALSI